MVFAEYFSSEDNIIFLHLLHCSRRKRKAEGIRYMPANRPSWERKGAFGSEKLAWHYQWALMLLGARLALTASPGNRKDNPRDTRIIKRVTEQKGITLLFTSWTRFDLQVDQCDNY